jgi:hypothetical protein
MTDKEAMTKDVLKYLQPNAIIPIDMETTTALVNALKERLAQPEQEPVATLEDLEQEIYQNTRNFISRDVMEWMLRRYYTTPPQRKPLTDKAITKVIDSMPRGINGWMSDWDLYEFARAIEAAHGIKENT